MTFKRWMMVSLLAVCTPAGVWGLSMQNTPTGYPKPRFTVQKSGREGQVQKKADDRDRNAATPPPLSQQPTTPNSNDACQQSQENLKIQEALRYYTAALVVVGGLQVIGLILQAWILHRTRLDIHGQLDVFRDQLAMMSRQTTWLIEKERPRLSIELDLYDPLQPPNIRGECCVTGSVSIYGHAVAKVQKAEIRVSTVKFVPEDAFSLYSQDVALADFMKSPDNIDIPRLIRPNSYDIGFSTPVYSGLDQPASIDDIKAVLRYRGPLRSYALCCRAKIEYSASNESWVEDVRMRLWVFADPYTEAEYGFWEEYGENQESSEDSAL